MNFLPAFLSRVFSMAAATPEERGVMCIVIRRRHAYLEKAFRRAFQGQRDVKLLVDRRYGERRVAPRSVPAERRRADRRRLREEVLDVVVLG